MEITDIIINKIENENSSKASVNLLIGFSNKIIGKTIGNFARQLINERPGLCSITILNLLTPETARKIDDLNVYQSELYADIDLTAESDKVTIRTFVKESEHFIKDIIAMADEQKSDMVLFGICPELFDNELWDKYIQLKCENNIFEEDVYNQTIGIQATSIIQNITNLLNKPDYSTGILVSSKKEQEFKNIFTILLRESDLYALPYINHLTRSEETNVYIWDAVGLLDANPNLKKTLNSITRKNDGKIRVWNNRKKIENEFILAQDLIVISSEGWERLIVTPLSWIEHLPSVLIIKD